MRVLTIGRREIASETIANRDGNSDSLKHQGFASRNTRRFDLRNTEEVIIQRRDFPKNTRNLIPSSCRGGGLNRDAECKIMRLCNFRERNIAGRLIEVA